MEFVLLNELLYLKLQITICFVFYRGDYRGDIFYKQMKSLGILVQTSDKEVGVLLTLRVFMCYFDGAISAVQMKKSSLFKLSISRETVLSSLKVIFVVGSPLCEWSNEFDLLLTKIMKINNF